MLNPPHKERNVKTTIGNHFHLDWQNSERLITDWRDWALPHKSEGYKVI